LAYQDGAWFEDQNFAKELMIARLSVDNVSLTTEGLDEILREHKDTKIQSIQIIATPKVGNFKLVNCCPRSIPVHVNNQLFLLPDNASTANLYSILQHVFDLDMPF
jgi:hypothetical protein